MRQPFDCLRDHAERLVIAEGLRSGLVSRHEWARSLPEGQGTTDLIAVGEPYAAWSASGYHLSRNRNKIAPTCFQMGNALGKRLGYLF